ncbi:MAG: hypothetical protein BACD_04236 [Bacteroides rodentium]
MKTSLYYNSIFILLLRGGGVPVGGGGSDTHCTIFHCFMLPTTPPFGHPSSPEEGNLDTI